MSRPWEDGAQGREGGPRVGLPRIGSQGSLTDRAYEVLKEAIVNRQLAPHQLLSEERLAQEMGISRTPLRAALQRLKFERLVTAVRGRGYTVARLARTDMEQVFYLRKLLEPQAARLAARHRTGAHLGRLRDLVARQRQALAHNQYLTFLRHDRDFHMVLASIPGNPYLETAIDSVQLHGHRFLVLDPTVRGRSAWAADEHDRLVEALEAGDEAQAERLMLDHVARTEAMLAEVLRGE